MNLKATGDFIKEQRLIKDLTQEQLANRLNVSAKTISKWECGKGFPDTGIMLELCDELGISANELLSGKKLLKDEYIHSAENNLIELKTKQERNSKFLLTCEIILGYMASISFIILVFVASYVDMTNLLRIGLIIVGLANFLIGISFCLLIEKDVGFYECKHCNNKYIPTFKSVLFAMHINRTRYMKCPKCGKKSWKKKVLK